MKNKNQILAFTLVELIVVIIILAILWTITFITMQSYVKNSRDSVRISDISIVERQLQIYLTRAWKLPIPENKIDIESSWSLLWYQWYVWENILSAIKIFSWWFDPLTDDYYVYRTNALLRSYQLMSYLEDDNNLSITSAISDTHAYEIIDRHPFVKWNSLWLLVDNLSNLPIQEVETVSPLEISTSIREVDMYLWTEDKVVWVLNTFTWTIETLAIHNYEL